MISSTPGALLIECRMALGLTQKQFAALFGVDRRTVQRWERGSVLWLPAHFDTFLRALRPLHPELVERVLGASQPHPKTDERVESVLVAAATAMGAAVQVVRPVVMAAFSRALEAGLDVKTVVEGLSRPTSGED